MHAFPIHVEKGNQENDRLTCTKLYRIQRDQSRTRATDKSSIIVRWGNPICVHYVVLCDIICGVKLYELCEIVMNSVKHWNTYMCVYWYVPLSVIRGISEMCYLKCMMKTCKHHCHSIMIITTCVMKGCMTWIRYMLHVTHKMTDSEVNMKSEW